MNKFSTVSAENSSVTSSSGRSESSNRRREVEQMIEMKKREEESNYTFAPKISTKVYISKDAEENRFMSLYSDAKKKLMLHKEERLKLDQAQTFAPKFSTKPSSRSNSRERGQSIGERLFNATSSAVKESSQSMRSTSSIENISLNSSMSSKSVCSFTPTISKRAKSIDRSGSADRGIGDRLYSHSKIIQEKLEKVKAERDHKVAESCTFVPKTNVTSVSTPSRSSSASKASSRASSVTQKRINDRMKEFEENKTKKIEIALQAKLQQETAEATFKPQLVAKRLPTPLANIPVHERLSQPTEKDISDIEAELYMENTFHPQLIARRVSSNTASEYASATERLYQEGERKKKESEQERQQQLEDRYKEFTFVPKLGFGGRIKEKDDDSSVHVFDRLASLHNKAFLDEILSKIKSEIELRDCTFQPKIITSRSTSESRDEPAYIRLNRQAEVMRAERIRREAEKISDELASATFSPCLPSSSIQIARRLMMGAHGEDDDVYSRLAKHSPKLLSELGNSFASEVGLESFSSDSNRSMLSRSKCGGLPEQDVDRIVQRLYSGHTKSSEMSLRISKEENSEQLCEKKLKSLPEKALGQVFRRLSLTENSSNSFIDNPMLTTTSLASLDGNAVTVFAPSTRSKGNRRSPVETTTAESSSHDSCCSESKASVDFDSELEHGENSDGKHGELIASDPVESASVRVRAARADQRASDMNKLRRSSSNSNMRSGTAGDRAQNEKPSQEFLSKVQQFSPTPFGLSSVSIEEKIIAAAAAIDLTCMAGSSSTSAAPLVVSAPSRTKAKSTAAAAPHIATTQTVASSHNQHQRALQLATKGQGIDDKWESKASKVLRGQKKAEKPVPEEGDVFADGPAKQ